METKTPPAFATTKEAFEWMFEGLHDDDEHCIDNVRFAFKDDHDGMVEYDAQHDSGCCGYYDTEVMVNGRLAALGCNYGH